MILPPPPLLLTSQESYFTHPINGIDHVFSALYQHALELEGYRSIFTTRKSRQAAIATINSNYKMVTKVDKSLQDISCAWKRLKNRNLHSLGDKEIPCTSQAFHSGERIPKAESIYIVKEKLLHKTPRHDQFVSPVLGVLLMIQSYLLISLAKYHTQQSNRITL